MRHAVLYSLCHACLLWLIFSVGCASSSNPGPAAETRIINFLDPRHGLKMVYTTDWGEQSFLKPRGTILMLTRGSDVLVLIGDEKPQDITSAQLAALDQQAVDQCRREFDHFELLEQSNTSVAGEPARRTIYTGKKLGVSLHMTQVLLVHGGRTYLIVHRCAPGDYRKSGPDVQKIIDSIEFVR
jgi:hypothetical protein